MMIEKQQNGTALTMSIDGRLDTATAPEFEEELRNSLPGVTSLTLDFSKLAYLSSAGLRVILSAQKQMNTQGDMVVRNVNSAIMEVFEITGFTDILSIE